MGAKDVLFFVQENLHAHTDTIPPFGARKRGVFWWAGLQKCQLFFMGAGILQISGC